MCESSPSGWFSLPGFGVILTCISRSLLVWLPKNDCAASRGPCALSSLLFCLVLMCSAAYPCLQNLLGSTSFPSVCCPGDTQGCKLGELQSSLVCFPSLRVRESRHLDNYFACFVCSRFSERTVNMGTVTLHWLEACDIFSFCWFLQSFTQWRKTCLSNIIVDQLDCQMQKN